MILNKIIVYQIMLQIRIDLIRRQLRPHQAMMNFPLFKLRMKELIDKHGIYSHHTLSQRLG